MSSLWMTRDSRMISGRVPTTVMTLSTDRLANHRKRQQRLLDLGDVQPSRVVRRVVVEVGDPWLAFDEVLIVIQAAGIGRDSVVAAKVSGPRHFLARHQRLVKFFAMAR